MKAAEIRELSAEDLQVKLKEAKAELFNLRFQMATSQLDNTARVKQVKKDIARIMGSADINIEYAYAYSGKKEAILVVRVDQVEDAIKALQAHGGRLMEERELA